MNKLHITLPVIAVALILWFGVSHYLELKRQVDVGDCILKGEPVDQIFDCPAETLLFQMLKDKKPIQYTPKKEFEV